MGSSFFITWAWPFPLLVVLTCKLFIKDKLRFRQLFICFIVPLLSMISSFTSNERKQLSLSNLCVNQTTEGQHYWEKCLRTPTGKKLMNYQDAWFMKHQGYIRELFCSCFSIFNQPDCENCCHETNHSVCYSYLPFTSTIHERNLYSSLDWSDSCT